MAIGTCATYGGIPPMKNNATVAMGVADYLGWDYKPKAGLPVVNLPRCPTQPGNTTEAWLHHHKAGCGFPTFDATVTDLLEDG